MGQADRTVGTYNNTIDVTDDAGRKVAKEIAEIRNRFLKHRLEKLSNAECVRLSQLVELIDKMFEVKPWLPSDKSRHRGESE